MGLALLGFVVLVVAMVLLLRVGANWIGSVLGRYTAERHHAAESILSTGRVPDGWKAEYERRSVRSPDPALRTRHYIRRLDDLLRYFRRAPVFDTEETRTRLLEDLEAVRERWIRGEGP